jgi:predicted ribosome quality control (RQC) complex YloA/Tae2 family protein
MGRHSNLSLAGERAVLGALKVVTERMSSRRPLLPGRPYAPPPADRPGLDVLDEHGLRALLVGGRPVWQELSGRVRGLGPLLAQEVAVRAGIDPSIPAGEAARHAGEILSALHGIAEVARTGTFQPVVYESDGRVAAFAAIPLRVYESMAMRPAASMSEAVDLYYRDRGEADPLKERSRPLASAVRSILSQRERALERNRETLAESADAEHLRVMGELLLTYGSRVRPGDTSVVVPDFTAGNTEITIPLDPALTPAANAQRLFRRYQKARAAARALPVRIAHLEAEMAALREALVQIETASSSDDLWEIHTDLAARGTLRRGPRSRPTRPSGPRRFRTPGGATIVAGRSARENEHVTFHVARPDDLWFHARGAAGAHVVLKTNGVPRDADITAAAQVAAFYSEGRNAGQVAVDYVERRRVRKARGAPPGTVAYEGEQTVRVRPVLPDAAPAAFSPIAGSRSGAQRRHALP